MENRALHAVEEHTRSLANGESVILVHWIGPTDYSLSRDEAAALFIERIGPACVSRAATDIVNFAWTCCRAPELPSRRWASQRRAPIRPCAAQIGGTGSVRIGPSRWTPA